MKLRRITAAVLACMLCCVFFTACSDDDMGGIMQTINKPNLAGKGQNAYYAKNSTTKQENWVIYATQDNLVKVDEENDSQQEKFCRVRLPESVQVQGEWAYYLITGEQQVKLQGLNKVKMDRTGKHTILENEIVYSYLVYGDEIFYLTQDDPRGEPSQDGLKACSLEGENQSGLYKGRVDRFYVNGDIFYLSVSGDSGEKIMRFDRKTGDAKEIYGSPELAEWVVDGDTVFCLLKKMENGQTLSASLLKISADGAQETLLDFSGEYFSQFLREMSYDGDTLYYINNKSLMAFDLKTKEIKSLYQDRSFVHYYIENHEIYVELQVFYIWQDKMELYRLSDRKQII